MAKIIANGTASSYSSQTSLHRLQGQRGCTKNTVGGSWPARQRNVEWALAATCNEVICAVSRRRDSSAPIDNRRRRYPNHPPIQDCSKRLSSSGPRIGPLTGPRLASPWGLSGPRIDCGREVGGTIKRNHPPLSSTQRVPIEHSPR